MSQAHDDRAPTLKEAEVLAQERAAIEDRRKAAGFSQVGDPAVDAVGLALSGGGVRSAAFNLGLLQALHHEGILRFVDYLSGVSGGSYVAGMVADSAVRTRGVGQHEFEFRSSDGSPSEPVRRVAERGNYLFRVDLLANRYFFGLLLNLLPRISLVVAVGAGVAWLWRLLDVHSLNDHLAALGNRTDYIPVLLPGFVALGVWLLVSLAALAFRSDPLTTVSRWLFWLAAGCFAIGAAVLMGNGDIAVGGAGAIQWQENLRIPAMILAALGLLPVFLPRRLIRSGVAPRSMIESWIFYYTSFVLFLGIPLIAIGWFARENVSGFATHRGPELVYGDVKDIDAFLDLFYPATWPRSREEERFPVPGAASLKLEVSRPTSTETADQLRRELWNRRTAEYLLNLSTAFPPSDPVAANLAPTSAADLETRERTSDVRELYDDHTAAFAADAPQPAILRREWPAWRYLRFVDRWEDYASGIVNRRLTTASGVFLGSAAAARRLEVRLLDEFNLRMRATGSNVLFRVVSDTKDKPLDTADKAAAAGASPASGNNPPADDRHVAAATSGLGQTATELFRRDNRLVNETRRASVNRGFLEGVFPQIVRPRSEILRTTLILHDQRHRAIWFWGSLLVCLVSSALINPNFTSLHDAYRDRLADAFLSGRDAADDNRPRPPLKLEDCRPEAFGAPLALFGAAAQTRSLWWRHPSQLEPVVDPFLLSAAACGSARLGFARTAALRRDPLTVADAMAISGAALSPNFFVHHLVAALLTVLNLRTGKWLPSPARWGLSRNRLSLLALAIDGIRNGLLGFQRRFLLVTDGGHIENLGLGPLLDRRCRLIIVSDAGHDPDYVFDDFARLARRYADQVAISGLERDGAWCVSTAFAPCAPAASSPAATATPTAGSPTGAPPEKGGRPRFICGRIKYCRPTDGPRRPAGAWLVYVKPSLSGREGLRIENYRARNAAFPHDPTTDQAFDRTQFEAYRELGYLTGQELARHLLSAGVAPEQQAAELWQRESFDPGWLAQRLIKGAPAEPGGMPTPDKRLEEAEVRRRVRGLLEDVDRGGDPRTALKKFKKLGPKAAAAMEEIVSAIVAEHPLDTALKAMIEEDWAGQGTEQLAAVVTGREVSSAVALAALEFLRDRLVDGRPPEAVIERLLTAAQPDSSLRLRAALRAVLIKTAKRHRGLREKIEAQLSRFG
jgi:hypothetical protein